MAFDFTQIPETKVDVVFEFEGQTLNCKLNLNKLTQAKINEFDKHGDTAVALATVIESWDADGLEYPDVEFLRTLPITFLSRLFNKCMEASRPKFQTAGQ